MLDWVGLAKVQLTFYAADAFSVYQPTASKHWRKQSRLMMITIPAVKQWVTPTHKWHSDWDEREKVALLRCKEHDRLNTPTGQRQLYNDTHYHQHATLSDTATG